MYKMIVTDIDGTLLTSSGEILEETRQALIKAQEKGSMVILGSGRVISSIINFCKEIKSDSYLIAGNGSIVFDIKKGENIFTNFMDKSKALKIIEICEQNSIYYNIYTVKEVYTKKIAYSTLFYNMENRKLPEEKKVKINLCENIYKKVKESNDMLISKITICDEHKSIFDSIISKLRDVKGVCVLDVSHASRKVINVGSEKVDINYYYTEVSKDNADKWTAVEFLANKLNISKDEIIAIGDNANDIMMVKNAGLGVMMGNAAPKYKDYADYVAPSNDENGVADVIDKYLK